MIVTEASGIIVLVNAEVERLFGYRREELLGKPIEMFFTPGVRSEQMHFREAYQAHPEARSMGAGGSLHMVRKDGSDLPVEISLNPISTPRGGWC
jgi:PAS domain S-box-containing protein